MQALFQALNSKTRIETLKLLMEREDCICHLAEKLRKDISTMSRHVGLLVRANLVETRKDGKMLMCRVKDEEALEELFNAINRLGGRT